VARPGAGGRRQQQSAEGFLLLGAGLVSAGTSPCRRLCCRCCPALTESQNGEVINEVRGGKTEVENKLGNLLQLKEA